MSADDYASSLRYMHVGKPWETIRSFGARIGFPAQDYAGQPLDLKQDLNDLALERHKCAHVATYGVTTIWVRTVPDRILRFAASFDIFATLGADLMRSGDAAFFADDGWLDNARVSLRFVRERKEGYFEIKENAKRSSFRHQDGDALFTQAATRCGDLEVLVRQNSQGNLLTWAVPVVDT